MCFEVREYASTYKHQLKDQDEWTCFKMSGPPSRCGKLLQNKGTCFQKIEPVSVRKNLLQGEIACFKSKVPVSRWNYPHEDDVMVLKWDDLFEVVIILFMTRWFGSIWRHLLPAEEICLLDDDLLLNEVICLLDNRTCFQMRRPTFRWRNVLLDKVTCFKTTGSASRRMSSFQDEGSSLNMRWSASKCENLLQNKSSWRQKDIFQNVGASSKMSR